MGKFSNFYLRYTVTNLAATTLILAQDIYDQYMIVRELFSGNDMSKQEEEEFLMTERSHRRMSLGLGSVALKRLVVAKKKRATIKMLNTQP
jgi:hypothetical protein